MLLADRRIELDPRPTSARAPVLPAVMLGHCPGNARWERLADDRALLAEIGALGFEREVRRLKALSQPALTPVAAADPGDDALRELYRLPIPVYSLGQFQALFPDAFETPTRYRSRLAGAMAWLPLAVQDFFDGAGALPAGATKLWIIRVPEVEGRAAMLPGAESSARLLDPAALGAFERALMIPEVGLIALPDLERLQIPANLADIPRVRLPNPEPRFLPCGHEINDGHRERRSGGEMPDDDPPLGAAASIAPILRALRRHRPDLQCLFALPFDADAGSEAPRPDRATLDYIATPPTALDPGGSLPAEAVTRLHQIQFLYPYLRGPDRPLGSPSGLIAGMQARVSAERGVWRSSAGQPLPGNAQPYPPPTQQLATDLRERPGIGVLLRRRGLVELDDERLAAPVLVTHAFSTGAAAERQDEHYRSGEVARFLGWLRRELTRLGEALLFDVDPRDPRPEIALRGLLTRLHQARALRGKLPEQAFRLRRLDAPVSQLLFEIEIAPAFPIDRIRLTFAQNRAAAGGTSIDVIASGGGNG